MGAEDLDGSVGVVSLEYGKTFVLELLRDVHKDDRFVLDDQNGDPLWHGIAPGGFTATRHAQRLDGANDPSKYSARQSNKPGQADVRNGRAASGRNRGYDAAVKALGP